MAVGDDIGSTLDERGDALEALLWGAVFLFTVALFLYEFGLGAMHSSDVTLQPIGAITDFAQTMWIAALIGGGGVVGLITYAIFRYSSGVRAEAAALEPGDWSFKLAVFTLAVFAVVSTTVFVGASTLAQTDEAGAAQAAEMHGTDREVEMSVLGAQWFWRFDTAGVPGTQGGHVVLPASTVIQFSTTSADVIHSFSIKELGVTKDALPGQINQGWFYVGSIEGESEYTVTAEDGSTMTLPADEYLVRCAELCGKGHSKMLATIYVVSPDDYESYVEAKGGSADDAFSTPDDGFEMASSGEPAGDGDDHADDSGGDH
jgi:cytochrome c oxidase subunit 2